MKKREIQELKNRSVEELERILSESREKLRALRVDLAGGKVKNIVSLRSLKKDIARILTFIQILKHAK